MKNLFNKSQFWLGLALVLVVTSAVAEESVHSDSSPLIVELVAEKTDVYIGEPVYIVARLRNTGSAPIPVPAMLEWQSAKLQLQIESPDGKPMLFTPLFFADTTIPLRDLAPGDMLTQALPVFFGSAGWTFREAGSYRLTIVYHHLTDRHDLLQSNAISLNVSSEQGSSEILVNDSAASFEAGKFMLWRQGDHLVDGISILERLIEKQPDSLLANYVRFALASNLSTGFRNYAIGQYRMADCNNALSLFDSVERGKLPVTLQEKMRMGQERCGVSPG